MLLLIPNEFCGNALLAKTGFFYQIQHRKKQIQQSVENKKARLHRKRAFRTN